MGMQKFADEVDKFGKRSYPNNVVEDLVLKKAKTYKKLTKNKTYAGGSEKYPILTKGNEANQGTQAEDTQISSGGKQTVLQVAPDIKCFTHVLKFSGLALSMLKGNAASFANTLTFAFDNGYKDSAKELNACAFRDGNNLLGTTTTAANGSTKTIATTAGVPTHFRVGTKVYFCVSGAETATLLPSYIGSVSLPTSVNGTFTIGLVDADGASMNVDTTTTAALKIVRGAYGNTYGTGFQGLPLISATSGTFMGVNKATAGNEYWQGVQVNAGSTNISDYILNKAVSLMELQKETEPNCLISNNTQFRMFLADTLPSVQLQADKRDTTPKAKYGWNGMEWHIDTDCPFGEVYLLDKEAFWLLENQPLKFDDTDGKILKWDASYDAFIAYIKSYGNYATNNCGAFCRMYGLNVPDVA